MEALRTAANDAIDEEKAKGAALLPKSVPRSDDDSKFIGVMDLNNASPLCARPTATPTRPLRGPSPKTW